MDNKVIFKKTIGEYTLSAERTPHSPYCLVLRESGEDYFNTVVVTLEDLKNIIKEAEVK
jgi:hypothetical protein